MPAISEPHASLRNGSQPGGAVFDCFRRWREQSLPHASYRIAPRFWTPASLTYTAPVQRGAPFVLQTFA
jgi:hypothetical protein